MSEDIKSGLQATEKSTPTPPPKKATAKITVRNNGLEAVLRLEPPQNGGDDLTFAELKIFLVQQGIIFGIDNEFLKLMSENPKYSMDFIIARGISHQDGENAEIIYYVEAKKAFKPKEREDGTIDFKDMGIVQEVQKGDVLCEKKPFTTGTNGTSVTGKSIAAKPGRDRAIYIGKNTNLSEDNLKLLAGLDGHVNIVGNKINVLNTFVVEGNVSAETGNINFSGNVIVKGDVSPGFSIKATGDITINGVVEAALISAGGSLMIHGGFHGGVKGQLEAGADIACMFIVGGKVTAAGDLETTYIMNATVKSGGEIRLTGKGLIRGGYIMAKSSVTANFFGHESSTANTVIEVGNDPYIPERFKEVSAEIANYEKNISNLELGIRTLLKLKEVGRLTPEKSAALDKTTNYIERLKTEYTEVKEEYDLLKKQIEEIGYGIVNVKKTAYRGLKIVIGSDTLVLQIDHSHVTFTRGNDGIKFAPLR